MGMYRQLATIERLLESKKRVEADDTLAAHNLATNIQIAASELVRATKRSDTHYANADCALHAKNLADNLSLYLQHHACIQKVKLPNLRPNTEGLLTSEGIPVAQRLDQTHTHTGTVKWLRDRCAHGEYDASPQGKEWRLGVAVNYLGMAEECLTAVHDKPTGTAHARSARAFARLHSISIATAGTLLAIFGTGLMLNASAQDLKGRARERELRNEMFLQYAPGAQEEAQRAPREPIHIVPAIRPGYADHVAITEDRILNAALDDCEMAYLCPRTESDFDAWLDRVKQERFAVHDCLPYWTGKTDYCPSYIRIR